MRSEIVAQCSIAGMQDGVVDVADRIGVPIAQKKARAEAGPANR